MVLSSEQYDEVRKIRLSQSGAIALVVGSQSIDIWGRDGSGLWAVKAVILATRVWDARFHPRTPDRGHLLASRSWK